MFACRSTPLPYKVCTIPAGVARISFPGVMVAGLMGWKGDAIRPVIEKYFNWFSLAFMALLIGGFLVVKWLH